MVFGGAVSLLLRLQPYFDRPFDVIIAITKEAFRAPDRYQGHSPAGLGSPDWCFKRSALSGRCDGILRLVASASQRHPGRLRFIMRSCGSDGSGADFQMLT